jgi:prepilin-type N-terminal cleavage/methylation domain-containing protein
MHRDIRRTGSPGGFTLIELTIVVLVILILMGLAVPRFSQITDSARQAECIANVRSIEMAITQWEQKNKKTFPQGWISINGLGGGGQAANDLSPYVNDIATFNCPLANNANGDYYYIIPSNDKTNKYTNYFPGVNCYFYGRPTALSNTNPHTSYTKDPY